MRRVSRKTKWMIALSFMVSAALIVTLALYVSAANKNGTQVNSGFIAGLIVLAVAVFAVFAIVRLRRGRYVKLLEEPYFAAYEKIRDALGTSELAFGEQREVREDVVAMLLAGQQAGRDVDDVVGGDISAFVQRVKEAFGYRSRFAFNLMEALQFGVALVTFIQMILFFEHMGEVGFFNAQIGVSLLIMFAPLVFVLYPVLRQQMRREKTMWVFALPIVYGVVFIGLQIFLDNVFGDVPGVRWFLDTDVKMIFSWWMAALLAAVLIGAQAAKRALRKRSIKML